MTTTTGKIVILKDGNNENILPKTSSLGVYMNDGKTLEELSSEGVYFTDTLDSVQISRPELIEKVNNIGLELKQKANDFDSLRLTNDKTITGAINELFTSVSNGKSLLASAITDKGISTLATDSFETMKENILKINSNNVNVGYISQTGKNIRLTHTLEREIMNLNIKSISVCGVEDSDGGYLLNYYIDNGVNKSDIRYNGYHHTIKIPYQLCGNSEKQNEVKQNPDGSFDFIRRCKIEGSVDTWSEFGTIPTSNTGLCTIFHNNKIYCIGGTDNGVTSNRVDIYDINTNSWLKGSNMITAKKYFTAQLYQNKIYCIGGYDTSYLNKVEIYDIESDSWSTGTSMSNSRAYFSSVLYNGKIYCMGGNNSSDYLNKVEIYDIESDNWSTATSMPIAKSGHISILYNNKIYCIGGSSSTDYLDRIDVYDIQSNSWSVANSKMPTARRYFTAQVYNGKIYCIGGNNGSYLNKVEIYDIESDNWSTATSMTSSLHGLSSIVYDNKIYCIGGYGGFYNNKIFIYELSNIIALDTEEVVNIGDISFNALNHITNIISLDEISPNITCDFPVELPNIKKIKGDD